MLINLFVIEALDTAFAALSDPTRRAILARLASGEATVGELSRPFPISAPAISRGQQRVIRLNPEGLKTAQEWLDQTRAFWNGAFDHLDTHLKHNPEGKTP